MTKRLLLTCALLALCGVLVGQPTAAQDNKADPVKTKEQKAADAVSAIAAAYQLTDLGRETRSPEMLIGAAKVLLSISVKPGDATVTAEGKPIKSEKGEPLKKVAHGWLKEAAMMAPGDKAVNEMVQRLLDQESQGAIGGPRHYFHTPGSGAVITWSVNFIGGQPASISVAGNGRNTLTLTVVSAGGATHSSTGLNPAVSFVPSRTNVHTITVVNNGPGSAAYTLYHN
jgi:hypothetical protein